MKLSWKIAVRFLRSSKGQTILIALGIAVGVSVQIFIGSLIQGLQRGLIDKTVGNASQVTIVSTLDTKLIEDVQSKIDLVKEKFPSIQAISRNADGSAFLTQEEKTFPVVVRGFVMEEAEQIYELSDRLVEGNLPSNSNEIIIGTNLRDELKVSNGDTITLITSKGKNVDMKIVGFYDLNVAAVNKSWVISTLTTSQELFEYGNQVTSIEMQMKEIFKADTLAKNLTIELNDSNVKVENWKDQNAELLSGLSGQSTSSLMIQVFVMISVVLGIASVLAISVVQKSKQIGILKAMGIRNRAASLVFLFQGFILGIIGAILGVLFGLGLALSFTTFAVNPDGTPVVDLYISTNFIITSSIIAVFAATFAALIPARRSSKLDPMEVIKNG